MVRHTIKGRIWIAAILGCIAVTAAFAAGCGGGGSTTSATGASGVSGASGSAPLSKDEYVSQANAVCAESNDKIASLQAPASNQLSDVQATVKEELPVNQDAYDKFTALTPPSELQAKADQLAALGKGQIALAQQLIAAQSADEANAIIAKGKALNTRFNSTAESMGLTECAKDVSPQG